MIAICGLHQLLVWSSEISSWCIWHLSSDPLPSCTPKTAEALKNKHVIRDLKILFGGGRNAQLKFFLLKRGDLGVHYFSYLSPKARNILFCGSIKVRFFGFFHIFCYFLVNFSKTTNLTKFKHTSLESWPKNLWVYTCWIKSEQNSSYWLPKLTLPQRKKSRLGSSLIGPKNNQQ